MTQTLALVSCLIFLILAGIHIYWILAGKWGHNAALPCTPEKTKALNPDPLATLLVILGLISFAALSLANAGIVAFPFDEKYLKILSLLISIIYAARAIGDFKFFGIFKIQEKGLFARNDTQSYIPLYVFLSISLLIITIK